MSFLPPVRTGLASGKSVESSGAALAKLPQPHLNESTPQQTPKQRIIPNDSIDESAEDTETPLPAPQHARKQGKRTVFKLSELLETTETPADDTEIEESVPAPVVLATPIYRSGASLAGAALAGMRPKPRN